MVCGHSQILTSVDQVLDSLVAHEESVPHRVLDSEVVWLAVIAVLGPVVEGEQCQAVQIHELAPDGVVEIGLVVERVVLVNPCEWLLILRALGGRGLVGGWGLDRHLVRGLLEAQKGFLDDLLSTFLFWLVKSVDLLLNRPAHK